MCGIVGIVQPENKGLIDSETLRLMNATLTQRGPDDEGYWIDRTVGLGMRRLSIIDVEGGHQPISNETQDVWTVFNGEIYNFLELRQMLIQKGHRFQTRTDTEVIVHLYEEEGEDFVQKLRGMFAIALWDGRSRKLLLYRDRIGIKPLHYWFQNGVLVFASEIKAILEYPDVERELSLPALSDFLSFLYIPSPKTIYQEIKKLPAGHRLCYQNGQIEITPYWDFSYQANGSLSEQEWIEKLRVALKESVKLHMISDVPLGAFLSGGVDSSTVVAYMSLLSGSPVKTFSMGFRNQQFDESSYALQVARAFGTDHHEEMVEVDALEILPKIVSSFDEPFADSSSIPTYLVSQFARKQVKVVLSGDGGDELFGGYLWTQRELWIEKYRRFPSMGRKGIDKLFLEENYRPLREAGFLRGVQRFLYDARLTPSESFARRAMCFQPWMKKELLQPDVAKGLEEDSTQLVRSLFEKMRAKSIMDQCFYFDSKVYLADDILAKVDRMSMVHSLEARVPLLDDKLVELACSIPFSLKMKHHKTKYILRKAMKGILPSRILRQRKQGFSIPLDTWFRGKLSSVVRKLLLDTTCQSRRFFRPEYVRWLLEEHSSGRQRFGSQLYALLVFEIWCRLGTETKGHAAHKTLSWGDLVR